MKTYRITSEHFVMPGETGETDAVMDSADLNELKRLAGLPITEGEAGVYTGNNSVPQASEEGIQSPVGSNISFTAAKRNELLDKYQARPGSELWFMINFQPVRGLGANAGTLEQHIQEYLKQHPEYRVENLPKLPGQ
jgi:hypothetical protein